MSCICQSCEKPYKVDIIVPDDLWERIKPIGKSKGGGLLCGSCIMKKIERDNGYNVFILKNIKSRR